MVLLDEWPGEWTRVVVFVVVMVVVVVLVLKWKAVMVESIIIVGKHMDSDGLVVVVFKIVVVVVVPGCIGGCC